MKAHIFQHVSFEGPGSIDLWLHARQAHVTTTRFYEHDALPALNDVDLLIIMGGPMSVNDEATLPWLRDEKRFIAEAIAAGKAVLGICLGSQLIASALGARIYPGLQKEIGWFDIVARPQQVTSRAGNDQTLFQLPETTRAFHWHGETFTLPDGATRLAGSAACALQAFQYGGRVIGLQCHLETTSADAEALLTHCREELAAAQGSVYVQTPAEIRAEPVETYRQMVALLTALLDFITDTAATTRTASSNLALVELINDLLPQTQCGQCGHQGCRPYAEAVAAGEALNRCPPGGAATIRDLAALLGREVLPLDPEHGVESERRIASIREAECIGCTKCIQACPVDAILGAPKLMHTVIVSECTGCDLCVEPCPVDCIDMLPVSAVPAAETSVGRQRSSHWRSRYEFRAQRLVSVRATQQARRQEVRNAAIEQPAAKVLEWVPLLNPEKARADIQAAVLRAKARKDALRRAAEEGR